MNVVSLQKPSLTFFKTTVRVYKTNDRFEKSSNHATNLKPQVRSHLDRWNRSICGQLRSAHVHPYPAKFTVKGGLGNQLFILKAQEKNVVTAQNNFERTEERYKLGQITSIEFRTAQINLINSKTALNNAKFDAKIIELNLLQLSGDILNVDF